MAKRQPLNVRYNNPGNLRTATLDDAYNFWGQDMVKGRDDSGFIQFASPKAGIDSLYQQLRVDAGRNHTLGSFLDKFTPVDDDPEGNAISKETVPNWLGVSLDTPLSDIDPRDLAEAITKKEGGQAAVDFFGPQLAPFVEMDKAQGDTIQRANEAELARFSTPREEPPAPETAPNAALERVLGVDASFPSRDRARSNMPASVLNSINAPAYEEQGPPAVDYYTAPNQQAMVRGAVGGITAKRPDGAQFYPATDYEKANAKAQMRLSDIGGNVGLTQFNTAPDFEKVLTEALGLRGAKDTPSVEIRGLNGQTMQGGEALRALGAENPTLTGQSPELQQVASQMAPTLDRSIRANRLMQQGPIRLREDVSPAPQPDPIENVTVENAVDAPAQPAASTTTQSSTVATNPESQAPASQDVPSQGQGRNILKFLGDNPEIINALGLLTQGVGDIYQNRAMAKANKQTAKQQRVNNAIAAFLGTRAEQATPRYKQSTGGGIAQALGQALSGYGQQRAATNAMRADIEGQRLDRESAERIAQIRADANRDVANLNLQGRGGGGDGGGSGAEDPNAILNTYMLALQSSPQNTEPYAEIIAQIPFVKRYYPKAVAAMSLSQTAGVALAVAVQGSKPTDKDAEALEKALPMPSDPLETQQAKLRNLRALINYGRNLQAQGNVLADGWGASIGANGAFSASDLDKFAGPPKQAGANGFSSLGSAQSVMAGN